MICTTIQNKTLEEIFSILDSGDVEMAEIRLDKCPLTPDDIEELFSTSDVPLVATCRINEIKSKLSGNTDAKPSDARKIDTRAVQEAESRLTAAIHAGAAFADLEIEAPPMMSKRIRRETNESGTVLIRSYHDFNGTDSLEALKALTEKCFSIGADIAKIVTTASEKDADRVLQLYEFFDPAKLIAFSMGEYGRSSRIECLAKGAPYTYAALSEDESAAPGQIPADEMRRLVYGEPTKFKQVAVCADKILDKATDSEEVALQMPASKSFAQRAIIAAALAEGTSILRGYSACGDNESAISVARALGADVRLGISYRDGKPVKDGSAITIKGIGAAPKSLNLRSLHVGESGLLTRLMIPLSAIICNGSVEISGEGTLVKRPLKGAREIMRTFGVELEQIDGQRDEASVNASADVRVPLRIEDHLEGGNATISGAGGSQIISGLMMALALADNESVIRITEPKSIPYLFITMDVMKAFGVKVWCDMEGGQDFAESQDWNDCSEIVLHIKGGQRYKAVDIDIEGDWSSAANFLVAGAVFGKMNIEGLDTGSLQADLSIMDILMEAGASLSQAGDNDSHGAIHVQRAPLNAFDIDASNCPDLFPIVSVLAAFCQGTSRIAGVGRLANKESDRGKAILMMLTQMGVKAKIEGDRLIVEGHSLAQRCLTDNMLKGGKYSSYHDHRMLMALKVAELGADCPIEIDDTECVAKSFPTFLELFERVVKN